MDALKCVLRAWADLAISAAFGVLIGLLVAAILASLALIFCFFSSASLDRRSENVRVLPVIALQRDQ